MLTTLTNKCDINFGLAHIADLVNNCGSCVLFTRGTIIEDVRNPSIIDQIISSKDNPKYTTWQNIYIFRIVLHLFGI